jgi:hypothetical protein
MSERKYRYRRLIKGDSLTVSRYAVSRISDGAEIGTVELATDVSTVTDRPLWRSFNRDGYIQSERMSTRREATAAIGVGVGNFIRGVTR